MATYARATICAEVNITEDGYLMVDEGGLVVVPGEDWLLAARSVESAGPGSMIVAWVTDSLLVDNWSGEEPLDRETALDWVRWLGPNCLLLRSKWGDLFQLPRGNYEDSVRWPSVASASEG